MVSRLCWPWVTQLWLFPPSCIVFVLLINNKPNELISVNKMFQLVTDTGKTPLCVCVCGVCMCVTIHAPVQVCVQNKGHSGAGVLIFWHRVSSEPGAHCLARLAHPWAVGICLSLPSPVLTGVAGIWRYAPLFFCGCWGSELGSLSCTVSNLPNELYFHPQEYHSSCHWLKNRIIFLV